MIRVTFINGSYYCESGKTKLKLKRDFFGKESKLRRLLAGDIVTYQNIHEDISGKWITIKARNNKIYDIRPEDLVYLKEHLRR